MNNHIVKLIESKEERVRCNSVNCTKCIYRESEVGYCWYTMTTNRANDTKDGYCNHFVDKQNILNSMEEK